MKRKIKQYRKPKKVRPAFEEIFFNLALDLSKRATCDRLKVGCVIVSENNRSIVGMGYNGSAAGLPNECQNKDKKGHCGCLHAEWNAIVNVNSQNGKLKAFVTHLPCNLCAQLLINMGVKQVNYLNDYRDDSGIKLLEKAKIKVEQWYL